MDMKVISSKTLGIDYPWYIESINFDESNKRLDSKLNFERGATFSQAELSGMAPYLNFFQHECYLKARVPRIKKVSHVAHEI